MNPVRAIWRSMSSEYRELAFAAVLGTIASLSAIALLGASGYLISRAAELPPVLTLTTAAVMVRMFALSRAGFRYVERLVGHDAAFRGLTQLRVHVYERLERVTPTGLSRFGRGDLLNRLVADVDAAMDIPLRVILPWAQAILVAIATAAFLLWLLPFAAAIIAGLAVVSIGLAPALVNALVRRADQELAPKRAAMQNVVVNSLDAHADLLAFGATKTALETVRQRDAALTRIAQREARSLGLAGGIGLLIQGAAVVLTLWVSIPAVSAGNVPPVWLAVAAFLPLALFDILNTLPTSATAYQTIRGSASRLMELNDLPNPVDETAQPDILVGAFSGIRCQGMTAAWTSQPVVFDIDLVVNRGERVAIVGPSGSGKSTIAAVLMGFLRYSGSAQVDGVEIRRIDGESLRSNMTLLTQRSHIFDTSIADNVRIGRAQTDDADIREVLDRAQLMSWVDQLPDGINTRVGAFGAATSGGERQRIALARVLLAHRPCVILDEPTEHLDVQTAEDLDRTMLQNMRGSTTLVITHRLRDIADADRIYVMEEGRVTSVGDWSDVMRTSEWFAHQWAREEGHEYMRSRVASLPVGQGISLS